MRVFARLVGALLLAAVTFPLAVHAAEVNFITDFGFYGRQSYFYVAYDKGYYKEEGIELNFLRGQGSIDAIKKVASGAAKIGFADAGALVWRAAMTASPLSSSRSSMQPPHAIFALADSGIKMPKDLEGKTIADSAFSAIPLIFNAYAQAAGIDATKVKWITAEVSSLPSLLATGQALTVSANSPSASRSSPPRLSRRRSCALPIRMRDSDYYGNGIVATERTIKDIRTAHWLLSRHPQGHALCLCRSLRLASIYGKKGMQKEKLSVAQEETRLAPIDPTGWALMAEAQYALGRPGKAGQAAQRALFLAKEPDEHAAMAARLQKILAGNR